MNGLNIPKSMKDRPAWVCWKMIERDGRLTKSPINPHTGGNAMSNNPETWGTYMKAVSCMAREKLDGIGFMFGDGWAGVDIDHCIDRDTGVISDLASSVVKLLDSYTELSPSGTGYHIILRGALPAGGRKNTDLGLEMYSEGRFFTMTGDRIGNVVEVQERTEQLAELHRLYMKPEKPAQEAREPSREAGVLDDDKLIEKIRGSKQGQLFDQLFYGNWKGQYPSQSEADMALCNILAFWCAGDVTQMDRIFRRSGLMREKWEERADYREQTLSTAAGDTRDGYKTRQSDDWIPGPDEDPSEAAPEEPALTVPVMPLRYAHEAVPADAAYHTLLAQGKRYSTDDTGNAQRMFDIYGANARFCHPHKKWFIWNAKLWTEDVNGGIKRLADQVIGQMYREMAKLEDAERAGLEKQIKRVRGTSGKKAMIEEMQHLAPVLPDEMDMDDHLLNCANGVIDLNTGELLPHSRDRFITRICPVDWDQDAQCPQWRAFMEEILPDPDVRLFVQKAVGYSLTGSGAEQCIFVMYGTGANGKGTFISVLRSMLGSYLMNAQSESLMNKERAGNAASSDLARLKGARMVTCPESEEGKRISEALVKQLTGDDSLTVRFLFGAEFEYVPTFKIWLATNHKPVVKGTDDGFWRRMRIIPFTVTIPDEKKDRNLAEKLKAELPGVLNWAIEGHRLWKAEGLRAVKAIRDATDEYRTEMDVIAAFLEECTRPDNVLRVRATELYDTYKAWCIINNEKPVTTTKFGLKLVEHGLEKQRTVDGIVYCNLVLFKRSADFYKRRAEHMTETQEDMPF